MIENLLLGWTVILIMKVTAIFGIALVAIRWLRRAPPRWKANILGAIFVVALFLPIAGSLLPRLDVPILKSPRIDSAPAVMFCADNSTGTSDSATDETTSNPALSAGTSRDDNESVLPFSLWSILAALWLAGVVVLLTSLVTAIRRIGVLRRRSYRASPEWERSLAHCLRTMRLRRSVTLHVTPELSSPMTSGAFRPRIYIPECGLFWSSERQRIVLFHELMHIRRHDWVSLILAHIVRALHWFNPMVWLAFRRLGSARELACDEGVIRLGTKPSVYASHLLAMTDSVPRTPGLSVSGLSMVTTHPVEGRLMSILNYDSKDRRTRNMMAPVFTVLCGLIGTIVMLAPSTKADADPSQDDASAESSDGRTVSLTLNNGRLEKSGDEDPRVYIQGHFQHNGNQITHYRLDNQLSISSEAHGKVEFRDDGSIESLGDGASVVLETSNEKKKVRLEIRSDSDGGFHYRYSVNGREARFDDGARRWRDTALAILAGRRQIGTCKGHVGTLKGKIGTIKGEVGTLKGKIGTLKGEVGTLKGRIGTIKGERGNLKGQIGSIKGQESGLKGQLNSLKSQQRSLQRRHEKVDDRRSRRELEKQIRDVGEHIDEVQVKIENLDGKRKIRAIERQIDELDSERKIAKIQRKIEDFNLEGKVDKIRAQIRDLGAEGRIERIRQEIEDYGLEERVEKIERQLEPHLDRMRKMMGAKKKRSRIV